MASSMWHDLFYDLRFIRLPSGKTSGYEHTGIFKMTGKPLQKIKVFFTFTETNHFN